MGFGFWSVRDEWMDLVGGWAVGQYGPVMGLFCGGGVRIFFLTSVGYGT